MAARANETPAATRRDRNEAEEALAEDLHRFVAPVVGPDDERRYTDSGIDVQRAYEGDDVAPGLGDRLGEPGEYPYTRGIHPGMYRDRLWTMRQYAGYATAEETNRRYRYLIEHGSTGLSRPLARAAVKRAEILAQNHPRPVVDPTDTGPHPSRGPLVG